LRPVPGTDPGTGIDRGTLSDSGTDPGHAAGPGLRLVLTRPAAQALPWVQVLQGRGLDAVALPLIAIGPPPEPAAVRQAWESLGGAAFVMFVSANAVQQFFALRPVDVTWPAALEAGCTGPGTARVLRAALEAAGARQAAVLEPDAGQALESESLWSRIAARDWRGRRVWVVRGEQGRDWLARQWREAGARVDFVCAYRRNAPVPDAAALAVLQTALAAPGRHLWHFSSAEAVDHLRALAPAADWSAAAALVTHPRIAAAAQGAGFVRVHLVEGGLEPLAQAMARLESGPS
jgi:uroporphyrinogen-III synthase